MAHGPYYMQGLIGCRYLTNNINIHGCMVTIQKQSNRGNSALPCHNCQLKLRAPLRRAETKCPVNGELCVAEASRAQKKNRVNVP